MNWCDNMLKKIRRYKRIVREKILRKPSQVILEMTNRCNLNCPYCMVGMQNELVAKHGNAAHDLMSREMGEMSEATFASVLTNIKDFGIAKVYMHFQGEPFLNKNIVKYAKALKDAGLEIGVFTNGLAFTDNNISAIADVELDLIRFSVDGATAQTYESNRVGGKFDKVVENMKKVAKAHEGKRTRIEWQFLPMRNNEHEVEQARLLAKDIGVNFFTKGFRPTDKSLMPVDKKYHASFHVKPCKDIYHQLGIYWNGDVVPCCYDVDGKEVMGNVLNDSLKNIWNNNKYKNFRTRLLNVLKQPKAEPSICKTCLRWR